MLEFHVAFVVIDNVQMEPYAAQFSIQLFRTLDLSNYLSIE